VTTSIYLDNAATSFPKPDAVYDAVDRYQRSNGRPVGRGTSDAAMEVLRTVDRCRMRAAELLGAAGKSQVVFTFNATDALNTVLHGLLRPGDHVVTAEGEHNSVLRPLRHLEQRGVTVTVVAVDPVGRFDASAIKAALRPDTRLIAVQHASNVTGILQPVDDVAQIAREAGARFLLDAAQTAGHMPLRQTDIGADYLACSGHKGLFGPLGTGLLLIAPGCERELEPLRQGGTGSRSEEETQPSHMPDRFESGNHNAPGLIGLEAALAFLQQLGADRIREHEQQLAQAFCEEVRGIHGVTLHSLADRTRHTGIVSVSSELYAADELATLLHQHFGIETRAGLHCAPGMHRRLGTLDRQGTVRFSPGLHNSLDDMQTAAAALKELHGAG